MHTEMEGEGGMLFFSPSVQIFSCFGCFISSVICLCSTVVVVVVVVVVVFDDNDMNNNINNNNNN